MPINSDSKVLLVDKRTSSDGKASLFCKTQSGLTADSLAQITFYDDGTNRGYFATAVADSVAGSITSFAVYYGVPEGGNAVASGDTGYVQIRGDYSNFQFTAAGATGSIGHACEVSVAEVLARGSVYCGAQQMFGILTEEVSASTTANIFLTGELSAGTS